MRSWIIAFLGISSAVWATRQVPLEVLEPTLKKEPWFTGPLLTFSGNNIPEGHLDLEPYVFATYSASEYDEDWKKVDATPIWTINTLAFIQVGVTTWLDFSLIPSWTYSISNESATFSLADSFASLGFQLLKQEKNSLIPSIRFLVYETFPVGRFENLDPDQFSTDSSGGGSYVTQLGLIGEWALRLWDNHWFTLRICGLYGIASTVRVHGFNTYGGAFDTNGWIHPGQNVEIEIGMEFNLSQRWVLAWDFLASYNTPVRFTGFPGYDTSTGLLADLNVGSSALYTIAQEIEYNWSQSLGLISGVWFTFAGRNADAFVSWITALNYYY